MIHLAFKLDTERRAREAYSEHPYIGYFSDRTEFLSPHPVTPRGEHWIGFPMHRPAVASRPRNFLLSRSQIRT